MRQNKGIDKPHGGRLTVYMTPRHAPAVVTALFALLVVTPVCGGLFGCGCDWPWNGLFIHCASLGDIRPGCPWCEHPALGLASLVLPLSAGLMLVRHGRRLGHPPAEAVSGFAVAVGMGLLGVLAGFATLGALTLTIQALPL